MREQFMVSIGFLTKDAITASDQALGAWLRLCAYSSPRLLGGVLTGAKGWDTATWSRVVGMPRRTIDAVVSAGLAEWRGDDLALNGYDLHGEVVWKKKSQGGQAGNQRRWSTPSPDPSPGRTPESESSSDSDGTPDRTPNRRSVALRSDSDASPVAGGTDDPTPNDGDDRTLRFIRSLGGYLDFRDENKRPDWLRDTAGLTLEQIREVFEWGRGHGTVITLPGRGPGYFGGVREHMREAAKKARTAALVAAERAARAAAESTEKTKREQQAEASAREWRAIVGGILAVYDEDPTRWVDALTEPQAAAIATMRTAYNAKKPLGVLVVRYQDALPTELMNQGRARGRELAETSEGATA